MPKDITYCATDKCDQDTCERHYTKVPKTGYARSEAKWADYWETCIFNDWEDE